MIKHYKLFSIMIALSWVVLAWSVVAMEIIRLSSTPWVVTGIVAGGFLILLHGCFFCVYHKAKKKVAGLQEQYIDTLKPDAPLRFCPSDEELIMAYESQEAEVMESQSLAESKIDESVNKIEESEMM